MKFFIKFINSIICILILGLVGCTCAPLKKADPLECFNRGIYGFNKGVDGLLIRPTARIYQQAVPKPFKTMIGNFFQNLREIPTIGNDILQARFKDARVASTRFILNTTLGIGGLLDVAAKAGLEVHTNDFGITLAKWGIVESVYVILPILGPSTARDAIGAWGVTYYMSVYPYIHSNRWRYGLLGLNLIDSRATFIKHEEAFAEAAVDEYKLVREAFLKHREYEINGEETSPKVNSTTDNSVHKESSHESVELQGPPP